MYQSLDDRIMHAGGQLVIEQGPAVWLEHRTNVVYDTANTAGTSFNLQRQQVGNQARCDSIDETPSSFSTALIGKVLYLVQAALRIITGTERRWR